VPRTSESEWAVIRQNWEFNWITNWDDIWSESFVSQWKTWLENSPSAHVFFHPALVRAWVDTYLPIRNIQPRILVAQSQSATVFLPMVLWKKNWKNAFQRVLIPVGYSDYDYHDPIIYNMAPATFRSTFWPAFREEVTRHLSCEYDCVQLSGMRENVIDEQSFIVEKEVCPCCDLGGFADCEQFINSLKKSLRGDIRRQLRRMAELGEVTYHVFSKQEEKAAFDSLGTFIEVHKDRWPNAYKAPGFHKNIVKYGLSEGLVHYSTLSIGSDIVAWHLGFIDRDRFYYYMPAHQPCYEKVSPSKVLLYHCVVDAIKRGISIFDHLRGEENYKSGWTDQVQHIYSMRLNQPALMSYLRNTFVDYIKPRLNEVVS